jgi:hypothetical protein
MTRLFSAVQHLSGALGNNKAIVTTLIDRFSAGVIDFIFATLYQVSANNIFRDLGAWSSVPLVLPCLMSSIATIPFLHGHKLLLMLPR